MRETNKKRIAVLRGGPSSEHNFSIDSGKNVLESLDHSKFIPVDIYIDKKGSWHLEGVVTDPYVALQHIDVVWNAMHGEYGEDGSVQAILEEIGKPYNGSNSFVSKLIIDKQTTKEILNQHAILNSRGVRITPIEKDLDNGLVEVWQKFHHPLIVKPTGSGSSVGLSIVSDFTSLSENVKNVLSKGHSVMVEEHVKGREVSVSVISDFRGRENYTPIALEVVYDGDIFDNKIKKSGNYSLRPLKNFNKNQISELSKIAIEIHQKLGLRHYSRSDFIVNEKGIYFLEINSLPGLSKKSILPNSLKESGISMSDFLTHVIERV